MAYLAMTEAKAKEFDEVETAALKLIKECLTDNREVDDEVKVAVKMLAVTAKNRQTLTAREAISWSMVSSLENPKQREHYIKVTQPEIKKALTGT